MISNITVILVNPQGDANIGSVARAMKNFSIHKLSLVSPCEYKTQSAFSWSAGASDILENAQVYSSLKDALRECTTAYAFTRRIGKSRKKHMNLEKAATSIASSVEAKKIALVFGQEDSGLSNENIRACDYTVNIETDISFASLNLSQAVALACCAVFSSRHTQHNCHTSKETMAFADKETVETIISKLEKTLSGLGYKDSKNNPLKSKIIKQFNMLFGRAGLSNRDIAMFEGLLARINEAIKSTKK